MTRRIEMLFRSVLIPYGDSAPRGDTSELYVGAGDRFDDDRRVVRTLVSALDRGSAAALHVCAAGDLLPTVSRAAAQPHRKVRFL
jgi:hypothetical protein